MNVRGFIRQLLPRARNGAPRRRRSYNAASTHRLNNDWLPPSQTGDAALRNAITTLRDRSRALERDNDYVRRFLSALDNNVLGADGVNLQMKIRFKVSNLFDKTANRMIEDAWTKWAEAVTASVNWEDSWIDLQRLVLRSCARDGGVFIRMERGPDLNPFNFALEVVEIDMLDMRYSDVLSNGHQVYMGIERDNRRRVVAYYLRVQHPGDDNFPVLSLADRVRIPAETMIHYYVKERPTQSIGVPWYVSPMIRLHHLERYEESELNAARNGADKGGWFQSETGEEYNGPKQTRTDAEGNKTEDTVSDFEPQSFDELPPGMEFHPYLPQHPNPPFNDFVRTTLHGISMGMDIDYPTLTGDLREANYSSMRHGKLEAQETWKKTQGHFIRKFAGHVFSNWLRMALLSGELDPLPMSKFNAFNQPKFRGRRWPWVDPKVDVEAALASIDGGLKTRTECAAENGGDLEDIFDQLEEEKKLAEERGLEFKTKNSKPAPAPAPAPEEESAAEEETETLDEDTQEEQP